jgi:ubiquinone/menaquinone biosynthesis C-methylase UbiE
MTTARIVPTEIVSCCVCGGDSHDVVGSGRDFEYDTCANTWNFVRCRTCGHHYLRERPAPAALTTIYPPTYGNYSNSSSQSLAFRLKAMMEAKTVRRLSRTLTHPSVFDVGCGDGRLLDVVKTVHPEPAWVGGCEISAVAAEQAVRKGYDIAIGSFESLPFAEAKHDLIFMIQVLEHLADPPSAIAKAGRMLRAGGQLVIETPSTDCSDFRLFKRRYWGGFHFPRHFNLFSREPLEQLLRAAGLEPVSYRVKVQPVHWVWTAHHWLMEKGAPAAVYRTFNIKNPFWLGLATMVDATQVVGRGQSSNMQIVAVKP